MSIKVMSLVWEKFPEGGSDMLVMLAMADWCNDEGLSLHPSNNAVARKCRISKRQAQRIIDSLVGDGWLSVIGNSKGGAPGDTKQYRLHVEKLRETDDIGVTGVTGVTGDKNTHRRVTSSAETGDTHVTQTTIEPSIEPSVFIPTSQAKPKNRTRLPDDFSPTPNHYALAAQLGVSIEIDQFRDYHNANGNKMADWNAALNTWIRNSAKWTRKPQATGKQANRDSYAAQAAQAAAKLNMGERNERTDERDITEYCTRVA